MMPGNRKKKQEEEKLSSLVREIERSAEFDVEEAKYRISDMIYGIMEEKNISRAELAGLMNRSRAFITKLLSGNNNFEVSTLVHVARALGYKIDVGFIPCTDSSTPESNGSSARNTAGKQPHQARNNEQAESRKKMQHNRGDGTTVPEKNSSGVAVKRRSKAS